MGMIKGLFCKVYFRDVFEGLVVKRVVFKGCFKKNIIYIIVVFFIQDSAPSTSQEHRSLSPSISILFIYELFFICRFLGLRDVLRVKLEIFLILFVFLFF